MYKLLFPLIDQVDPETAHNTVRSLAPLGTLPGVRQVLQSVYDYQNPRLTQTALGGIVFRNPVGLAAGFDKYGAFIDVMPLLGFGFMEAGSISALPRLGNPQPRIFRLTRDHAMINRMGLNNEGAEVFARMIAQKTPQIPVGINIVKTHDESIMGQEGINDFVKSYRLLAPHASYITLNVSCPNTAEGKTFEDPEALDALLTAVAAARVELEQDAKHIPPLLLKFSPDRTDSELRNMVAVCEQHNVDGYILTNTTTSRENLETSQMKLHDIGMGGLSGSPLFEKSLHAVKVLYQTLDNPFIIAVGGIDSADRAYQMITSGASLVQVYTGMIYNGPAIVKEINKGIVRHLDSDGFESITQAIGSAFRVQSS